MSFKTNSIYFNEFDYIAVFIKGIVNTESAASIINYAKEEMQKYNCIRVFFDVSDTLSNATASANFDFAKRLPELLQNTTDFRWAVYYRNDAHMYEITAAVAEEADINNLKFSADRETAMRWLLK